MVINVKKSISVRAFYRYAGALVGELITLDVKTQKSHGGFAAGPSVPVRAGYSNDSSDPRTSWACPPTQGSTESAQAPRTHHPTALSVGCAPARSVA